MELKDRIVIARERAQLSRVQLAKALGVSLTSVGYWEAGTTTPRMPRIAKIARVTGVDANWLAVGIGGPEWLGELAHAGDANREVPLISWVQAGSWMDTDDPYPPGEADTWVQYRGKLSDSAFALVVRGDSMTAPTGLPTFPEGTIIVVDPEEQADHRDFVIAKLGDREEATFKQLVMEGDRRYLAPLNPRYPVLPIDEPCTICGVVMAIAQMQIRTKRR